VSKSYQYTKLRPLSVKICGILSVKYRLNIANNTKKTPKSKSYLVLILSRTVYAVDKDNVNGKTRDMKPRIRVEAKYVLRRYILPLLVPILRSVICVLSARFCLFAALSFRRKVMIDLYSR
jgi:hypothetical protein